MKGPGHPRSYREPALASLGHPDVATDNTGPYKSANLEGYPDRLRIRLHRGLQRKRNLLLHL